MQQQLKQAFTSDIATLCACLAHWGAPLPPSQLSSFLGAFITYSSAWSPRCLTNMCWALTKMKVQPGEAFLSCLRKEGLRLRGYFSPKQVEVLLWVREQGQWQMEEGWVEGAMGAGFGKGLQQEQLQWRWHQQKQQMEQQQQLWEGVQVINHHQQQQLEQAQEQQDGCCKQVQCLGVQHQQQQDVQLEQQQKRQGEGHKRGRGRCWPQERLAQVGMPQSFPPPHSAGLHIQAPDELHESEADLLRATCWKQPNQQQQEQQQQRVLMWPSRPCEAHSISSSVTLVRL